jgi:hypothetical protein
MAFSAHGQMNFAPNFKYINKYFKNIYDNKFVNPPLKEVIKKSEFGPSKLDQSCFLSSWSFGLGAKPISSRWFW